MASPSLKCFAKESRMSCSSSCPSRETRPTHAIQILYLLVSIVCLLFLICGLIIRMLHIIWRICGADDDVKSLLELCLSRISNKWNPTRLPRPLLMDLLPSNSPKRDVLHSSDVLRLEGRGSGDSGDLDGKRKKKKGKKRKSKQVVLNCKDLNQEELAESGSVKVHGEEELGFKKMTKEDLVCFYPVTSSSSATQRKIRQHYDQLVQSHESNKLTFAEVGHFVNCLAEARTELQQKSEMIQRKLTITKGLLIRADRSSVDRIRKQLEKLDLDQKRLDEDAFVYNWLEHQLKLSPEYKKMIESGASMEETKAKPDEVLEDDDDDFPDISFEELLAQEKKDSFWKKHGMMRWTSPPT